MRMKTAIVMALLALNIKAQAENCESIIALSKTISTVVQDESGVNSHATMFCNEYSQAQKAGRSMEISASYDFLSASFGANKVSAVQIASKYCSASSDYRRRDDAYRQYVETISPNAYSAYEQCTAMRNKYLVFEIKTETLLATEMVISVKFVQSSAESRASLSYNASSGITCAWDQGSGQTFKFTSAGSTGLTCRRTDATKKGYVVVRRTDSTDELAFSWIAMNSNGDPLDTLVNMQMQIKTLLTDIATLEKQIKSMTLAEAASHLAMSQRIDVIDNRFATLQLTQTCSPKDWLPVPTAGACPNGFRDTGLLISYSAPGGRHGFGGNCRICYKVNQ